MDVRFQGWYQKQPLEMFYKTVALKNFAKFLKTPFLQNISQRPLMWFDKSSILKASLSKIACLLWTSSQDLTMWTFFSRLHFVNVTLVSTEKRNNLQVFYFKKIFTKIRKEEKIQNITWKNSLEINQRFLRWSSFRSSRRELFLEKGVLKICSKFTGEYPCRSATSIKLLSNFIEIVLRHGLLLIMNIVQWSWAL